MAKYVGIDVYHLSGVDNWNTIKSAVDFAVLKIGQGNGIDSKFNAWSSECEQVGLPYGGYWFVNSTTVAGAEAEADRCIATLQGKNITFPVAYDYEPTGLDVNDQSVRLLACQMCRAFLNKILNAGYMPMLYTNKAFYSTLFQDIVNNEIHNGTYELWIARYFGSDATNGLNYPFLPSRENPDDSSTHFENLGMWQWGYWNNVPGISNHVDANISYKNYGNIMPPRPPLPTYHKMPLWMMLRPN